MNNFYDLLFEFENNCPTRYTKEQYSPKIKILLDYFTNNYDINNIESFLKYSVNSDDLVKSAIEYIEIKKLNSEQAIYDYIIAFNQFFKFLNSSKNIENTNWIRVFNNSVELRQIPTKIKKILTDRNIYLKPRQKYPAICEDEFIYIYNYLDKKNDFSNYKETQCQIILRLFLLIGLKPEKLFGLSSDSLDLVYNYLKIPSETNKSNCYLIHLPKSISFQFKKLFELRKNDTPREILFYKENGNSLSNDYTNEMLKDIELCFYNDNLIDNNIKKIDRSQFTQTGLAKYAIVNMIKVNISKSLILDFTGNKNDIYDDCNDTYSNDNFPQNNRYLSSKLRSIETFDNFDNLTF